MEQDFRSRQDNTFRRWKIRNFYGVELKAFLIHFYQKLMLSADEIAEKITKECEMEITARTITRWLKLNEIPIRTRSEAFQLAIKNGRIDYSHQKKTKFFKRKTVQLKTRMKILSRDNFKCVLCGNTPQNGAILEVGHIVAVANGGTNDETNLQTECFACNHGKLA